jgi:hypothetical protein
VHDTTRAGLLTMIASLGVPIGTFGYWYASPAAGVLGAQRGLLRGGSHRAGARGYRRPRRRRGGRLNSLRIAELTRQSHRRRYGSPHQSPTLPRRIRGRSQTRRCPRVVPAA